MQGQSVGRNGGPKNIDLTTRQRAIAQQIHEDQVELTLLEQRTTQLMARIHANRGKLELIEELTKEYGVEQPVLK